MLSPELLDGLKPCDDSPLAKTRQLYLGLYQAIVGGTLPGGTRLPPSRELAMQLGLARNTVIRVYTQLADEAMLETGGRRGTRVSFGSADTPEAQPHASPAGTSLSHRSRSATPRRTAVRSLAPGEPDAQLFPEQQWRRAQARAARACRQDLGYRVASLPALQVSISRYLLTYRSLSVLPEQIIVTSGTRQSLLLAGSLYADAGDTAWVESPGYLGAVEAFRMLSLDVQASRVDREGLITTRSGRGSGRSTNIDPRLIYLTPCFQYPTGVPLSAVRRRALLDLSAARGIALFEDDYDSEFRDHSQPQPALAAEARESGACVLHAGTFSKLIFPAVRVAWLVVPAEHVPSANAVLRALGGGHNTLAQATVAELIDSGALARHLQQSRQVYAQRRRVLLDAIANSRHLTAADSGQGSLSLVLNLRNPCRRSDLEQRLVADGIGAQAMECLHWQTRPSSRCRQLVVGLGNVESLALPDIVHRLDRHVGQARA